MNKPLISIVTPTYNEEENVFELYKRICNVINKITEYRFDIIFIDNASEDSTLERIKELVINDKRVKIIVNLKNYGHIRSPYWGILQTNESNATIYLASDLQDPPELIPEFILQWERGWRIVLGVKPESSTNLIAHKLRRLAYYTLVKMGGVSVIKDSTGFGIYDNSVIKTLKEINDPYPFLRGLICELGFPITTIPFKQAKRVAGFSKNHFFTLYDIGMLGLVSHSMVPLRFSVLLGFLIGSLSIIATVYFTIIKLLYWDSFPLGITPFFIIFCLISSAILIILGILGEYIGSIQKYVQKRPIVIEKERINF